MLGAGLNDVREENFCLMVCDGISLAIAFERAGFKSGNTAAPSNLFHLDRIQHRTNEILEARRTTGVVSLSEVTDMLQRVFTGALHRDEYSAAHNAAFSLARLYGHVTDRSTVEVIRRPSRDPDAPSEQALASWVNSLPVIDHVDLGAPPGAPASLLGTPADNLATVASSSPPVPSDLASVSNDLGLATAADSLATPSDPIAHATHSHLDWCEKPNDFNELEICSRSVQAGGRPENGAPSRAVTGTPAPRARSSLLGPAGGSEKEAPLPNRQVPGTSGGCDTPEVALRSEWPPAEDLF